MRAEAGEASTIRGALNRGLRIPRRREESDSPSPPARKALAASVPEPDETYRPRGAANPP
jgi:hypothetical protein